MDTASSSSSPPPMSSPSWLDHKNNLRMLKSMKLLLSVVFVGWIMIWIMMPTNTYRYHWSPKLYSDTNSTYFGTQGSIILIFTFPILFIFVLGCIILHLEKRSEINTKKRSGLNTRLVAWKRPVLVKGPLGIVSGIELAFIVMFLALLTWCFSTYLKTGFSRLRPNALEKMWEQKLESTALRFGLIGNLCCAFLFFPVSRGSSILPLIGLTSESSVKYHIWLGHTVMVLFTLHGIGYVIYWAATDQIVQMVKWDKVGVSNVAGEIALLAGFGLWATTIPRIRRKMFEVFFYTHHLYIPFLFFYLMHLGISFICLILPGIYLFMVDRYLRFLQSRTNVRLLSARLLPSEAVELNFAKTPGFQYKPLSTVFINIPSVSSLQWHPYTVSSSSSLEPERLSVIIKKEGSWTQKLYNKLSSSLPDSRLEVSVEGPYSPTTMEFLRYESLVMVSGGSGITPFISIIREFISRSNTLNIPTPNILLVCAFRTSADLTMLDLLLPVSGNTSDLSRLRLRIEAFVTREKAPVGDAENLIRTVWFKPRPSDSPVAPVLGQNSWLWLAAIVSSSFVAYLVLIGILERYYIYPIDHNTNRVYSYASRSVLNLLFICFCIAAAASAAFVWNKRGNSKEARQIQNMDAPTPMVSPSSWFYNADRELESSPKDSLVKTTNVHFGRRPELKRMLLEIEDPNVGVMSSGPSEMRHEVASICSSGLADNLHFESISFTW